MAIEQDVPKYTTMYLEACKAVVDVEWAAMATKELVLRRYIFVEDAC